MMHISSTDSDIQKSLQYILYECLGFFSSVDDQEEKGKSKRIFPIYLSL